MNNYKFDFDLDSLDADLLCIICKGVMIDPCQSFCDCQYCYKCINEYIGDEVKYCPGNNGVCKEEYLQMDVNVLRSASLNRKIYKMKVHCPNELCTFKTELIQMEDHLRVCIKQRIDCPYVTFGCDSNSTAKDTLVTHLNNELLPHTQLLLEFIENMKNELNALKMNVEQSNLEIHSLKEDSRIKDMKMEEANVEVMELRRVIIDLKTETKEEVANLKREMEFVKEECLKKENRITILEERLRDESNEMESRLSGTMEIRTMFNEKKKIFPSNNTFSIRKHLKPSKMGSLEDVTLKNDTAKRAMKWTQSCPNVDADFAWLINQWIKIEETEHVPFFSDPFYSKNYKLRLRVDVQHNDKIWIGCIIMKGDYDDNVRWPMKSAVTLSLIDQNRLKPYKSVTIQYDTYDWSKAMFDRPMNDNDWGFGSYDVIQYSSIKDNPSIIVNDSIVVSCSLND